MNYAALFRFSERDDYILLVCGVIAAIGSGVPLPLIGILFGQLIDGFNGISCGSDSEPTSPAQRDAFQSNVNDKVVKIVIVAAVNFCLIWIYTSCWSTIGERLVRRMREKYLEAVLRQDMTFFDTLKPGEVGTRLSADLTTIQTGTSEKVGILISSMSYFVTSVSAYSCTLKLRVPCRALTLVTFFFPQYIVAFIKLPVLAAELVSLLPAFGLISVIGAQFVSRYTVSCSQHLSHATSLASEALGNLNIVQAFGAQKRLGYIYESHLELARKEGTKKALSAAIMLGCLL